MVRVVEGVPGTRPDTLTVEEPLEIRVGGKASLDAIRTIAT